MIIFNVVLLRMIIYLFLKLWFIFSEEMDQDQLPKMKTIHCIQYKRLFHINPLLHHLPNMELAQSTIKYFSLHIHLIKIIFFS